jgi:hypothetical protein
MGVVKRNQISRGRGERHGRELVEKLTESPRQFLSQIRVLEMELMLILQ